MNPTILGISEGLQNKQGKYELYGSRKRGAGGGEKPVGGGGPIEEVLRSKIRPMGGDRWAKVGGSRRPGVVFLALYESEGGGGKVRGGVKQGWNQKRLDLEGRGYARIRSEQLACLQLNGKNHEGCWGGSGGAEKSNTWRVSKRKGI